MLRTFTVFLALTTMLCETSLGSENTITKGWVLESEAVRAPRSLLKHYDSVTEEVTLQIMCYPDYYDVVISLYPEMSDQPDLATIDLLLSNSETELRLPAVGNNIDGRYVVEASARLVEPLNSMLLSQFLVTIDGWVMGQFSAEPGRATLEKFIEDCIASIDAEVNAS